MSELILYKAGDTLELQSGGVLFKGSITLIKTGNDVGLRQNKEKGLMKSNTLAVGKFSG